MSIVNDLVESLKGKWIRRKINGYSDYVYYQLLDVKHNQRRSYIKTMRFYPKTQKWVKEEITRLDVLMDCEQVKDNELNSYLDAEYAKFFLTSER